MSTATGLMHVRMPTTGNEAGRWAAVPHICSNAGCRDSAQGQWGAPLLHSGAAASNNHAQPCAVCPLDTEPQISECSTTESKNIVDVW